jgi:hypothetical protein
VYACKGQFSHFDTFACFAQIPISRIYSYSRVKLALSMWRSWTANPNPHATPPNITIAQVRPAIQPGPGVCMTTFVCVRSKHVG